MPIAASSNAAAAKLPRSHTSNRRDARPPATSTVPTAGMLPVLPVNVMGISGST